MARYTRKIRACELIEAEAEINPNAPVSIERLIERWHETYPTREYNIRNPRILMRITKELRSRNPGWENVTRRALMNVDTFLDAEDNDSINAFVPGRGPGSKTAGWFLSSPEHNAMIRAGSHTRVARHAGGIRSNQTTLVGNVRERNIPVEDLAGVLALQPLTLSIEDVRERASRNLLN